MTTDKLKRLWLPEVYFVTTTEDNVRGDHLTTVILTNIVRESPVTITDSIIMNGNVPKYVLGLSVYQNLNL